MTTTKTQTQKQPSQFSWAVPEELGIPPDQLRLRLDFHHQAVVMTYFDGDVVETKLVSAVAVAHALASELSFGTGLLPENTLWWANTPQGPLVSVYVEPQVWKVALQVSLDKPARRLQLPQPGLIFLCAPSRPPWVYAVKKRPTKPTDAVYNAPLCNIFKGGRSCPGSHQYPNDVRETVSSFFLSFFSKAGDLRDRSVMFPDSVVKLWDFLDLGPDASHAGDKKRKFPLDDLVELCTVNDLMRVEPR